MAKLLRQHDSQRIEHLMNQDMVLSMESYQLSTWHHKIYECRFASLPLTGHLSTLFQKFRAIVYHQKSLNLILAYSSQGISDALMTNTVLLPMQYQEENEATSPQHPSNHSILLRTKSQFQNLPGSQQIFLYASYACLNLLKRGKFTVMHVETFCHHWDLLDYFHFHQEIESVLIENLVKI